jgi:hypothetical protein
MSFLNVASQTEKTSPGNVLKYSPDQERDDRGRFGSGGGGGVKPASHSGEPAGGSWLRVDRAGSEKMANEHRRIAAAHRIPRGQGARRYDSPSKDGAHQRAAAAHDKAAAAHDKAALSLSAKDGAAAQEASMAADKASNKTATFGRRNSLF